jgi:predicted ATPase
MVFQFDRTASRLAEMQTREYLEQPRAGPGQG